MPWRTVAVALSLYGFLSLYGCSDENDYVAPPPLRVEVALPVTQTVTPYLNATGSTAAVNTTTLVARVAGFIQEIDYKDGDEVKAGDRLFLIEPEPYELALEQAKAGQVSAGAAAKQSGTESKRQQDLLTQNVISQSDADQAAAAAEVDVAKQQQAEVDVKQAELNLSYTEVKAPFDGIATARQVSLGQFVAAGTTTLATVVQLDPIYVNFSISEPEVLKVRANMAKRGITTSDLKNVPVEVGLQNETGYPHKGSLDYVSPSVDATTGTLSARAVLASADRTLLPGYFVRVRIPLAQEPDMLLVPDRAIGADQGGRYVLVAGKDDVVEQRAVEIGQAVGELRVIASGVTPQDRIIVSGLMGAVPGQTIDPQLKTITAASADGADP